MQYAPLCANAFSNGPYFNYTPPMQCGAIYPEIVGEGDVTQLTLPDGTVQYLFTPSVKWWAPYQFNPNTNCNRPYTNNTGAWIIRSITNPIPTTYTTPNDLYEVPRPFGATNGYTLKFHNDCCTSTTDIHYFYPTLRRYNCWPLTMSTAAQAEIPITDNTVHHYNIVCACKCVNKPCHLMDYSDNSNMSIIENTSRDSLKCSSSKEFKKPKQKRRCCMRKSKKTKSKSKNVICECDKPQKAGRVDKSVTTYADNASSCTPMGGRETQTPCDKAMSVMDDKKGFERRNVQTGRWSPNASVSKRNKEDISLTKLLSLSNSCSTNCSCRSDTDSTDK